MSVRTFLVVVSGWLLLACGEGGPEPAHVTIQTNLQGAELYLDGVSIGGLRNGRQLQLSPGTHALEARMGPQILATAAPNVSAGEGTTVQLNGTQPPPSAAPSPPTSSNPSPTPSGGAPMQPLGGGGGAPTPAPSGGGSLTLGEPTVRGSLPSAVVDRVVRRHRSELEACARPGLSGTGTLAFTIDATGRAQAGSLRQASFADPTVGACVAGAPARWVFPSSSGGQVQVEIPLTFAPR